MTKSNLKPLLSEVLRPKCLSDLIVPKSSKQILEKFVSDKSIMNITFYGSPGAGKTSAARMILDVIDADVYKINGSEHPVDKNLAKNINNFASTCSFEAKIKVVFIDEADKLEKNVQEALRYIIENTSFNCRYLLTVNDISKITEALQSRCMPICFDVPKKELDSIIQSAVSKYSKKIEEQNIDIDPQTIKEIVELRFPDYRSIANHLESASK